MNDQMLYTRKRALASGIPLGGLGTGSVEIREDGRFHDWEICNNNLWSGNPDHYAPDMWSEDAFFAVRVKEHDQSLPTVRLLYDDDKRSRAISLKHDYCRVYNFPFLWNIEEIEYRGKFPFANLNYKDSKLPCSISMRAFSPFIPHNAKDSGLPLSFFVFNVKNTGTKVTDFSLMYSLRNLVGYDQDEISLHNKVVNENEMTAISMGSENFDQNERTWGSQTIAVLDSDATWETGWTDDRGLLGFPNPHAPGFGEVFLKFRDKGELGKDSSVFHRTEAKSASVDNMRVLSEMRDKIHHWRSSLCKKVTLAPGEETQIVFAMSWFFPNHYYRQLKTCRLGHMYENWFTSARDVLKYGVTHFDHLYTQSDNFCKNLYQGLDLPVADSLNAQLTSFPQSFWWTKNGDFTMWEGMACCQIMPAAATPWSSFMPVLFFPELYLEMKRKTARFTPNSELPEESSIKTFLEADQYYRQKGRISQENKNDLGGWFRNRFKLAGYTEESFSFRGKGRRRSAFGFEGAAAQLLRDYMWTGDRAYLVEVWPLVKEHINNNLEADLDGDGLPDGEISFITYDHWFLPGLNCYRASMWLAELASTIQIARIMRDPHTADTLQKVLNKGKLTFETRLWNGEYYNLAWDFKRNSEDKGCLADQVSGHLYLRLCGIDPVHTPANVKAALKAVFKYNRRPEEGLLNGADPHGRTDWLYFARYSERGQDEELGGQWTTPWTGTEYYVAALMIAEGLVTEGLQVIGDVYDRHCAFGQMYNHIECGEHYFRPLSVWAVLVSMQGVIRDEESGYLRIGPKSDPEDCDTMFILPSSWGRLTQIRNDLSQVNTIRIEEGKLGIKILDIECQLEAFTTVLCSSIDGEFPIKTEIPEKGIIRVLFPNRVELTKGSVLTLEIV